MARLSQAQLEMYARSAGLSAGAARTAAAVGMAESGGNPHAHNPIPPDNSYGLWQINMYGKLGPARRAKFGLSSNSDLYDPATNARAMAAISHGGSDFSPWSTYTSGAYRKYLSGGGAVQASDAQQAGVGDLLGSGLDGLKGLLSIAELMVGAGRWIANPHNWVRVLQVGVGVGIVYVGVGIVAKGELRPVLQQVAGALPTGKAATAVKAAASSGGEAGTQ